MKIRIFGIFILLLSTLISLHAQTVKSLIPTTIELGEAMAGDTLRGTILFTVEGSKSVEITDIKTSCGCTVPELNKRIYAPGDTAKIPFTIKTSGFRGHIRKMITIFFKSPDIEPLKYVAKANIKSQVAVNPPFINFKNVPLRPDSTIKHKVVFENNTTVPIKITKIVVDNPMLKVINPPIRVAAGDKASFVVEFKPIKTGRFPIRITLQTDYPQRERVVIPVLVNVVADTAPSN